MTGILITGVSGFIGQALSKHFTAKGYVVYGLYEFESSMEKNPEIPFHNKYLGSITDADFMDSLANLIEPDYVIHLAARSEVANSFNNYLEVADINYKGTVTVAEAHRKYNPHLKQFIMASTMETYGHQTSRRPFNEDTPQHPAAPYAVAKVASEHYLRYMHYAYDFPYTIFRQTNSYGRYDNDFFVVERILTQFKAVYEGKKGTVDLGGHSPVRNFLFIDDLVSLYDVALGNESALGETFVTGPNNGISIRELAYKIGALFDFGTVDCDLIINWGTLPPRPGEIFYLNSDPAKAKAVLGWEPKVSLEQGLALTKAMWE